jgi:hypothetical protein
MSLSEAEIARYARQIVLPGVGAMAQEFMRAARVHVVGAGPVAGPALLFLAQAGIGTLFVDDASDVSDEDRTSWLYAAAQVGEPRAFAAMEAVKAASSYPKPRPYATGADPTAVLVCPGWQGVAREAAERARLAGVPHGVAIADGDGGEVVAVPPGAPCYSCATRPGTGARARPGATAAIGALGALELLLLICGAYQGPGGPAGQGGRRTDLILGQPQTRPTTRVPGCPCANRAAF